MYDLQRFIIICTTITIVLLFCLISCLYWIRCYDVNHIIKELIISHITSYNYDSLNSIRLHVLLKAIIITVNPLDKTIDHVMPNFFTTNAYKMSSVYFVTINHETKPHLKQRDRRPSRNPTTGFPNSTFLCVYLFLKFWYKRLCCT